MIMSTRSRERPPSGRININPSSARQSSIRPVTAGNKYNDNDSNSFNNHINSSSRPLSSRDYYQQSTRSYNNINSKDSGRLMDRTEPGVAAVLLSDRSDSSELSTNEVLRRLREANDVSKNRKAEAEIQALGDYNYYSRPRCSAELPLRTVFLDPTVNNFPRSRTRSELMHRIKLSGEPHPSYDLDNDGYVSQEDYRLAKRFDFDGNGVLDPSERKVGKRVLAEEFFKRHAHHLNIFGPSIANTSHKKNVDNLVNSYCFERAYDKLLQLERTVAGEGSKRVLNCMRNGYTKDLLKHNYYTNKFDATAWNDLDAIPRSESKLGSTTHHEGSRKKLLFSRRESLRSELQERMQATTFKNTNSGNNNNFRRMNLITNVAIENS